MNRFKNILIYLPDEGHDELTITWLQHISRESNPQSITLLHCVENYLPHHPRLENTEDALEAQKARLSHYLDKLSDLPVESKVLSEQALKSILHELSDGVYDLIITTIDSYESRILTERLARKSPVGVLCLPPNSPPQFERLLLTMDFSDLTQLTIEWTEAFASLSEAPSQLEALHVFKLPDGSRATHMLDKNELRKDLYHWSQENINKTLDEHTKLTNQWETCVAEHPIPAVQILEEARIRESGLVVIGSHGRNSLSIALLGGQTAEVIRNTLVPVLIVKRKNESLPFLRRLIGLGS